MNHAVRAAFALALGTGLAAAAQAHGVTPQGAAATINNQSATAGQMQTRSADGATLTPQEVRQAQQQLKSDGLYKGALDGIMGHRTRLAIARFQQKNGLPRTARLDQRTLDRLTGGSQAVGVGSSMPKAGSGMSTTAPKGAGDNSAAAPMTPPTTNPTAPSTGSTSNPTTNQKPKY
jgi:peptidoglycan hydrolase-like protein with peptidoglycan-binding domain